MDARTETRFTDLETSLSLRDLDSLLRATAPLERSAGRLTDDVPTDRLERRRELERECGEVTAAILTAASSNVSRVIVCGLRRPGVVVEALRGVASELALDLVLIARPDGTGSDIAVAPR